MSTTEASRDDAINWDYRHALRTAIREAVDAVTVAAEIRQRLESGRVPGNSDTRRLAQTVTLLSEQVAALNALNAYRTEDTP